MSSECSSGSENTISKTITLAPYDVSASISLVIVVLGQGHLPSSSRLFSSMVAITTSPLAFIAGLPLNLASMVFSSRTPKKEGDMRYMAANRMLIEAAILM